MNNDYLELELRLLMLRYGRHRVSAALEKLDDVRPEDVKRELDISEAKHRKKKQNRTGSRQKPQSFDDLVEIECHQHPELAEPLRNLAANFQNRTFLPQLRDVRQFLNRVGLPDTEVRSRQSAAPIILRALTGFRRDELFRLATEDWSRGDGDFALLAETIMGTPGTKLTDAAKRDE